MSDKPNPHVQEFDRFIESINVLISPKLIWSDANYQILRRAAFALYGAKEEPGTLVEAKVYERVFLGVKDQLQFAEPKKEKATDYGLTADGRPRVQGLHHLSKDDLNSEERRRQKEHVQIDKAIRSDAAQRAEKAKRWEEENAVVYYDNGRINHGASDELRRAAKKRHLEEDRRRGITNG